MTDTSSSVPIAKVIKGLRQELSNAIAEGDDKDLRFKLGPVELEFQVEVSDDASVEGTLEGGLRIGVISIGKVSASGGYEHSRGTTHTIKMTLMPELSNGQGGTTPHVTVNSASDLTEPPRR
ncbi:MAG: hypothetical protein F6K16_38315 [Symploca sp. SIO2B6]|nr:hypothetical protein [Symploca sp. SIO2B6]